MKIVLQKRLWTFQVIFRQCFLTPTKLKKKFDQSRLFLYGERQKGVKADFQSVLRTLESLFMFFVLHHVRLHKM